MEDLLKRLVDREEKNSGSIAVQESVAKGIRVDLDRAMRELEEIRNTVHRIEVGQAIRNGAPLCSAPNLCLELRTHMEELARTVQTLMENRAEARGGVRVAMAIATCGGTVGGAILSYLVTHFLKP